ncbi:hypothetical protein MUN82_01130 [Hymenobacter aerilatus]|uniref:Uncharacterized protein n=1 Tax=Hymenobacter aerilatus TaxID=2932251 RepID=A0A8T9SVD1_9BACT|nr:hypothetical protein [Hymenobacter aerilatus]UOR05717.1 hypothetical protein MUN82_01130 [Hymenobacter aerilatus]
MKKHLLSLQRGVVALLVTATALTSCNRAEYAMLPKTQAYHGMQYTATAPKPTPAPEVAAPQTPAAAPIEAPVVATAPAVATAPVEAAAPVTTPAPATKPAKAQKLNLMQKALVNKVTKQANKVASKMQIKQKNETAETNRLDGNIRTGIILVLVGLLVSLLSFISGIFGVLGGIIAIVGIVFIVLGLLDMA